MAVKLIQQSQHSRTDSWDFLKESNRSQHIADALHVITTRWM